MSRQANLPVSWNEFNEKYSKLIKNTRQEIHGLKLRLNILLEREKFITEMTEILDKKNIEKMAFTMKEHILDRDKEVYNFHG